MANATLARNGYNYKKKSETFQTTCVSKGKKSLRSKNIEIVRILKI